MADDADRASELQQRMNDVALLNYKRQHQMRHVSNTECIDCDNSIETKRISLLKAERCIECQKIYEQHQGNYRGR